MLYLADKVSRSVNSMCESLMLMPKMVASLILSLFLLSVSANALPKRAAGPHQGCGSKFKKLAIPLALVGAGVYGLVQIRNQKAEPPIPAIEQPMVAKANDPTRFISPFTGKTASKEKFFVLRDLSFDETLEKIRADGVHVVFLDTANGTKNNSDAMKWNGDVSDRVISAFETDMKFNQGQKNAVPKTKNSSIFSSMNLLGTYQDISSTISDENGNSIELPFRDSPAISINLADKPTSQSLLTTLQHEYAHHLFASSSPTEHQDGLSAIIARGIKRFRRISK